MYQSFTGSSRRHRQINLSGRPTNPFAAVSSSSTPGPQSAVATAHADRASRALQREKLQASLRIQRVWRGHDARRKTFKAWRQIWDGLEEQSSAAFQALEPTTGVSQAADRTPPYTSSDQSLAQLARLLLFFNSREDVRRLTWYVSRQVATSGTVRCEDRPWPRAYLRMTRALLSSLQRQTEGRDITLLLLMLLAFCAKQTELGWTDAVAYYAILTRLSGVPQQQLRDALLAPLETSPAAYTGLAVLLAKPLDQGMLSMLRASIDQAELSRALASARDVISGESARSRLWLLGNTIFLSRGATNGSWTAVIARLLASLAEDVDFEGKPVESDNIEFDRDVVAKSTSCIPLNLFLSEQIRSLIDQSSIRSLLSHGHGAAMDQTRDARFLAEYALTLLRCFPAEADAIRMWLYRTPTRAGDLPATQYFWNSAKDCVVFSTIRDNSRSAVSLVKASNPASDLKEDWTVILVFLELFTFLLKITDDEEFMGGGKRGSAIPLPDVADLVTFLKNLGFALYFNAPQLSDTNDTRAIESQLDLSRQFGNPATGSVKSAEVSKPATVAGLPALTVDYLKGLVTGLLRAIYERDSRRRFLPPGHWLMTSRFDMTSFIPSVVLEEEKRHVLQDEDDDDNKDDVSDDDNPALIRGYAAALRSQEARARAQRRASRRRHLESVAPRLEILQNMPFFIPFTTRVEIFRQFVQLDQQRRRNGHVDPDLWRHAMMFQPNNGIPPRELLARHHAKIRRKNEFSDAFEQFYELGVGLKEPIQITFVDEFDIPEAGIDGGGVTKEFLTSVITQACDPAKLEESGLEKFFVENEQHLLYPNPTVLEDLKAKWAEMGFPNNHRAITDESRNLLRQYEFLGRVIGKCLYEGILVDVTFAGFFLKKWALTGGSGSAPGESGYRANINDLRELDEGLYRGLLSLKNCAAAEVESLGLTFTVDDLVGSSGKKKVVEHELLPGGADTAVTSDNRLLYISNMARYRLQGQSARQTTAFLRGLSSIVQPSWLSMFNQTELQTLIGGAAAEINVADLRRHTLYGGTYVVGDDGREHPSVQLFWQVMAALPDADRRAVLKFVTSTPRGPLLGFGSLNPRFSIRDSGSDENRFPTTSTCVNLLKLPMYRSEKVLREKLLAAINSGAGFDLS